MSRSKLNYKVYNGKSLKNFMENIRIYIISLLFSTGIIIGAISINSNSLILENIKTYIENFSSSSYSKVKVLVYTTGGIDPLNQSGNKTNSTYDNPYFIEIDEFDAKEKIEYEWSFAADMG